MSLYRFARTTALLTLAGRYRAKLFKLFIAVAVALVTAWVFDDIALYLDGHKPEWLGPALIIKTLVVYGALVYAFWQLRPGSWAEPAREKPAASAPAPETAQIDTPGPLDELLDKPKLVKRKDAILDKPAGKQKPGA
ncbi:MAG: hypothetical protein V2I66_01650 [Halieaceae bacterium]|jgi:hypothetical protein|nr:hypothetical protein [Halieaceae bacterium]